MALTSLIRGMGRTDLRQVRRDSFLRWLVLMPFGYALLLRFGGPALAEQFAGRIDIPAFYPLAVSYVLVEMVPILIGVMVGFLLLDERDEQTLQALLVSPLPLRLYLAYKVAAPMLLSVVLTVLVVPLSGLVSIGPWALLVIALAAAVSAPVVGLFIVAFAENKVQGFAQLKILGSVAIVPVAAYFVAEPWQYLFGVIFPPYWALKSFWLAAAGDPRYLFFAVIGVLANGALLWLLVRRFDTVIHR
jgi:fluoroquinolone transport system permease protein